MMTNSLFIPISCRLVSPRPAVSLMQWSRPILGLPPKLVSWLLIQLPSHLVLISGFVFKERPVPNTVWLGS